MRKSLVLMTLVGSFLLSSCSFFSTVQSYQETVHLYDLDKIAKNPEDNDINKAEVTTVDALFIKGEKYIPYLSLKQYGKLFDRFLVKGARSEFKYDRYNSSWAIYVDEELYFYTVVSVTQKCIIKAGDIENAFDPDLTPRDVKALNYGLKNEGEFTLLGNEQYETYDFSDNSFHFLRNNGQAYFPLGLLDLSFSDSASYYLFYDYEQLYMASDVEYFTNVKFNKDNEELSVDEEMDQAVSNKVMPQYLIEYNANLFMYLMDNLYGLKSNKKISSMKSYYEKNNIYSSLFSNDNIARGYAYSQALNILDDNHTTLVSVNNTWHEAHSAPFGKGVTARRALRIKLKEVRQSYYQSVLGKEEQPAGGIIYSDDQKTAMFHFEQFIFGTSEQVFDGNDKVKEDAYLYDTYFNFIRILNIVKNKGGVKNIIIDISTNGGGTVGVMMKLLALLSKDNHGSIAFCNGLNMGVSTYNFSVDVNADNNYSSNETFGKDFNFYLLTSDCSFSCANAFPCYAQKMGVKIIGEKSGGGECAVAIHYLPNSQYVYHSSNLHLGYLNEDKTEFIGLEGGAKPDIALNNNSPMCYVDDNDKVQYSIPTNFFDINFLNEKIANS